MIRRLRFAIGVCLLSICLLVQVSPKGFATTKLVHYGYSGHAEAWREFVEEKAAQFEASHPDVSIEILVEGGATYVDKYLLMLAGGVPPDVTEFNDRDGGALKSEDAFLDLRPYLERQFDTTNLLPVSLKAFTWTDGSIWGFPVDSGPNVTIFNRDLFETHGLVSPDLNPNQWTWEYAKTAAKALTRDLNGDGTIDQWGITDINRMWAQGTPVRQAGGCWFDRFINPTKSMLDSQEVLRGLEFLTELKKMNVEGSSAAFVAGNVGFNLSQSPGIIPIWLTPGRVVLGVDAGTFDWGMALPLLGPANRGTLVFSDGFQVSKDSANKELAMEWVLFLMGDKESTDYFVSKTGRISANRRSLSTFGQTLGLTNQMLDVVSYTMNDPESYSNYAGGAAHLVRNLLNTNVRTRVFTGEESPRNVLLDLHSQANALIAEENAKEK